MDASGALDFVRQHGVVLVSAKGPVPRMTDAIAGETVKGSWWGHPKGKQIFRVLQQVCDSDQVLVCRLVNDKVTLVHRRLWPALAACAPQLAPSRTCRVEQEHTSTGHHENREIAFPGWVPADVLDAAASIPLADALAALGPWAKI
ncbi:MAG: hypothetical protein V4508_17380 [Pseudomonadota bacterium]